MEKNFHFIIMRQFPITCVCSGISNLACVVQKNKHKLNEKIIHLVFEIHVYYVTILLRNNAVNISGKN